MKFSRKNTTLRTVTAILCGTLLFGCFTARQAFLGPGLSSAAALTAGTPVSATDLPLTPIVPEDGIAAITPNPGATYTPNAALQIVVNQANINSATIQIAFDEQTYLYGFHNVAITAVRANTMVSVTYSNNIGYININITASDAVTQGQRLLRFYFYSLPSTVNPCDQITCTATASDINNTPITNAFAFQKVLLGNPEYDAQAGETITNGTVDSKDSLWVLQYTTGKHTASCCPDIELRKLAADVDLDGTVGAADSQLILKRPVGKNLSFLDINRIFTPYGASASGTPCQIKHTYSGYSLKRSSNDSLCLSWSGTTSNSLFRFEKVSSYTTPVYRIYSLYDNQELCLDTNNNLVLTGSGATIKPNSNQWYVIPQGTGYILMNMQTGDQTLGTSGKTAVLSTCDMSYLDVSNVWEITPYISLELFYDAAYVDWHASGTDIAEELNGIRNEMATILENIFDITINTNVSASQHTSLLDSQLGVDNKDSLCSCSGTNPNVCKAYNSTGTPPNSAVHHTSSVAQLYHFKTTKSNGIAYRLLYTGYRNCGRRKLDDGQEIHANDVVAGIANPNNQVALAFYRGTDDFYNKKLAALHELSHMLGAFGGEDDSPDSDHGNCVMSYDASTSFIQDLWEIVIDKDETVTQEMRVTASKALFCSECKQLMADFLQVTLEEE